MQNFNDTKSFEDLNLSEALLKTIEKKGFEVPTPIQCLTIPRLLSDEATNIVAKARTGTGKTAAFALPVIQNLTTECEQVQNAKLKHTQALILVPTRELAIQVSDETASFIGASPLNIATIYGGSSYSPQLKALKAGAQIVVGTPGRVIDHLERGSLDISQIKYFILDEADEMLNMGFVEDIEKIFEQANKNAHILMFSATMPKAILDIAHRFMGDFETIEEKVCEELVVLQQQSFYVLQEKDKIEALARIIDSSKDFYSLVFCQTKIDTEDVAKALEERGYDAVALHGDIPQTIREKILERFRRKLITILVATDVAARGIDVEGLTHVVNYALPFDSAIYTHRIGRTGRAGKSGIAISFVRPQELRRIEYIKRETKFEIAEEAIPSIRDVLENKKTRLLSSLCKKLENRIEKCEEDAQNQLEDTFSSFKDKLLEYGSAEDILLHLLHLDYAHLLSPSQYKNIKPLYREKSGTKRKEGIKDATRIFISWGYKDGATKKRIANFLAEMLGIGQHLVDAIEIENKFSLCSLPSKYALMATRISQKRRDVPHMHIDEKNTSLKASNKKQFTSNKSNTSNKKNDFHKEGYRDIHSKSESYTKKNESRKRETHREREKNYSKEEMQKRKKKRERSR